jgi:hypothetical protein
MPPRIREVMLGALLVWMTSLLPLDAATPERTVSGQVLSSGLAPTARLVFASNFKYAGGQRFILYGVADAEQHFFVDADEAGSIRSFYWVQFEHFLPGKGETYNYPRRAIVKIGPLEFLADTKVFAEYSKTVLDFSSQTESDSGHVGMFLRSKGLKPPAAAARIRMFHLPDSEHRSELMIIYVEALSRGDIGPGDLPRESPADEKWPAIARRVTEDARRGLSITVP